MESPANISNMRILALFRNAWHRLLAQVASVLKRVSPSLYRVGEPSPQANFVEGSHTSKSKITYFDQIERFFAITSYKFSRFKNFRF